MIRFVSLTTFVMVLVCAQIASADSDRRKSSINVGAGIMRSVLTIRDSGTKSTFAGWGPQAHVNFDFAFGRNWGSFVGAEGGRMEVANTLQSSTYGEKASYDQLGAKLGLYFGYLSVGGGVRQNQLHLTPISSSGSSPIDMNGLTQFGFASLSFDSHQFLRTSVSVNFEKGDLSGRSLEQIQYGLSLTLLF